MKQNFKETLKVFVFLKKIYGNTTISSDKRTDLILTVVLKCITKAWTMLTCYASFRVKELEKFFRNQPKTYFSSIFRKRWYRGETWLSCVKDPCRL